MNRIAAIKNEAPPRIVAVAGGKGGIGKSTITAEIAKSIGNTGKRVLCVDAHAHKTSLNLLFHTQSPEFDFERDAVDSIESDNSHIADFIKSVDDNSSVWLASIAASREYPHQAIDLDPLELVQQLRDIDFDWIILDVPSEWHHFYARLFVASDIPIVVTTPEPVTVKQTTDFLQRVSIEAIRQYADIKFSTGGQLDEDVLSELPYDFHAKRLADDLDEYELQKAVQEGIKRFESYTVVNKVREGSERDLGFSLCHAWYKEIGVFPRALASIEYKDRRWFYNRRMTKNATGGDRSLSEDIERLMRLLYNLERFDEKYPRPIPSGQKLSMAEKIGINPDLEDRKIRQQTRRLWETYRRENLTQVIFSSAERRNEITEALKRLYKDVLSSSTTERSKNVAAESSSGPPVEQSADAVSESAGDQPTQQAQEPSESEDKPPQNAQTDTSGWKDLEDVDDLPGSEVVEKRQAMQLSRHDLSVQTQIGMEFIEAIENTEVDKLPRKVYLKGYLRKLAKVLNLDEDAFVSNYLSQIEAD